MQPPSMRGRKPLGGDGKRKVVTQARSNIRAARLSVTTTATWMRTIIITHLSYIR